MFRNRINSWKKEEGNVKKTAFVLGALIVAAPAFADSGIGRTPAGDPASGVGRAIVVAEISSPVGTPNSGVGRTPAGEPASGVGRLPGDIEKPNSGLGRSQA